MTNRVILTLFLTITAMAAQAQPEGVRVSAWVREDIFAGFMANDMERFASGMKKLDSVLAGSPGDAHALCWKGGAQLWLAVRAHETGREAEFEPLYAKALATLEQGRKAAEGTDGMEGIYAITGGSWAVSADRLPARLRRVAWNNVRANYTALRELQKDYFDKLPAHMKGEILAGLAQAAQRLGEQQELQRGLQDVVDQLPGSVYAARAKRWQGRPEAAMGSSMTCQTCHDAGRLEAVLARATR